MGDSDEEYDRRRGGRDKFRRERNDYERREERRGGGGGGGRENWDDRAGGREGWQGGRRREGYRADYERGRRDRYGSPPPGGPNRQSPPMKRMRRDWDDGGYPPYDMPYGGGRPMHGGPPHGGGWGGGHNNPGDMHGPPQGAGGHFNPPAPRGPDGPGGGPGGPDMPAIMSFKHFLSQQDDNITDDEAMRKFSDYRDDYRRQQLSRFFAQHKEEEWFRSKYHPEDCVRRREYSRAALIRRRDVFTRLLDSGMVDALRADINHTDALIKLLDVAVIYLEGGDESDLEVLNKPKPEEKPAVTATDEANRSRNNSESQPADKKDPIRITFKKTKKPSEDGEEEEEEGEADEDDGNNGEEEGANQDAKSKDAEGRPKSGKAAAGKSGSRKIRKREYRSDSESESGSASDSDDTHNTGGIDATAAYTIDPVVLGGKMVEKPATETSEKEASKKDNEKDQDAKLANGGVDAVTGEGTGATEEGAQKPRELHRTCSIFLRNLAPTITKQEVEAMCKKYPGFMRVALQDPQPDRRFFRRGWVTFDSTVNIREICWTLTNMRLKECEMGAIVNRELKQRVRLVNGIAAHRPIVKADMKYAAKIVQHFDDRWRLWEEEDNVVATATTTATGGEDGATEKTDEEKAVKEMPPPAATYGMVSKNRILKNITDYLVDEGSYEEEALMGETSLDEKSKETEVTCDKDDELLQVLDRMIIYLRIVHSFDYYSAVEYPNEDEMPHRCGIMHARGNAANTTSADVNEWLMNLDMKVAPFTSAQPVPDEQEAIKLGRKDVDAELEKFVTTNTQEVSRDKWLCPLSGKKFKGPEFVRKHIFNKHAEKVNEVKQEVAFFNNYLMDPKRPQNLEAGRNKGVGGPAGRGDGFMPPGGGGGGFQGGGGMHQGGMGYHRPPQMYGNRRGNRRGGGFGGYHQRGGGHDQYPRRDRFPGGMGGRRERSRPDPRFIVEYRDLDAPDDVEGF